MPVIPGKFLSFLLAGEEYGIPINKVKEIIGIMDITSVPRMPEYIKGVINLRGKIITVMDLRLRFEMQPAEYNNRTCIIVVEYPVNEIKKQKGIIVDTVSEVVAISQENMEAPPEPEKSRDNGSISSVGKFRDRVLMLLDVDRLMGEPDSIESIK